jgi:hypothetical protein
MISDKISIDFFHEGTGKLIFPRQYSRELVDRVCKERDLTEREWVTGTLGKALSFLGLGSMSARTLQFTSTDDVVLQIQIPAMAWDAFAVCAARRKVEPASHLAVLVGRSIANGITVAEWWSGSALKKSTPDIARFKERNLTGFRMRRSLEETAKRLRNVRWLVTLVEV